MLPFSPARFDTSAVRGGGFVGPLDAYSTGIFAAVSSRRLFSSFVGSPLRLRVQPGATEADIAFASDFLDVDSAARSTLLGSSDGRIVTAYDQTNLGSRNFTQGTAANQPIVKDSGTLQTINNRQAWKGTSGSSSQLLATAASVSHGIGTGDFLVSAIIKRHSADSLAPPVWSIGSSSIQLCGMSRGFPYNSPGIYVAGSTKHFPESNVPLTNGQTYVLTWTRESGTLKLYVDGVVKATTHADTTNVTSDRLVILGERSGSTWSGPDCLLEILFSTSVANRAAIIANQMIYAGL